MLIRCSPAYPKMGLQTPEKGVLSCTLPTVDMDKKTHVVIA